MSPPTPTSRAVPDLSPGALCAQCARIQYTCCQPAYGITVSFHDARRLVARTGKRLGAICHLAEIRDTELREGLQADPWFRRLFVGERRLLQTLPRGQDCHLLGKQGCTVFEDRPRLCRLHPFWFQRRRDGSFTFAWDAIDTAEEAKDSDCLIVRKLWPERDQGFASIGEDDPTLTHQAARMVEEIRWQKAQVTRLGRRVDLEKVTIADLEPLVMAAPGFEV